MKAHLIGLTFLGLRQAAYAIGSTHRVRHAGDVNGSEKYCVSWDTLSPLNSMMLTV